MSYSFGNLPYVVIGSQKWQRRNLDVSTYRNGDTIPYIKDATEWANLTTGAWCWYNNDPELGKIYGKLYNWYAVTDPRNLAPEGWSIPTQGDWSTLSGFLGKTGGGDLKQQGTTLWNSPNVGARDLYRFTALPGGFRWTLGSFANLGDSVFFWTSSDLSPGTPGDGLSFAIQNSDDQIYQNALEKIGGASVRCLKD